MTGGPRPVAARFVIVRHGTTELTEQRRFQGRMDVHLNDAGRDDARRLAEALAGLAAPVVWHSPLARARETAEIIGAALDLPLQVEDRLAELSFGTWEGREHAEVRATEPELFARRRADPMHNTPPGGEPLTSLFARLRSFLDDLGAAGPGPHLVVTHEGILRAAPVLLGLLDVRDYYPFSPPCGSAIDLACDDGTWSARILCAPDEVLAPLRRGDSRIEGVA